ncbi:hypothetical protein Dimus_005793, partial [Dionaea muscipula]
KVEENKEEKKGNGDAIQAKEEDGGATMIILKWICIVRVVPRKFGDPSNTLK